jgi:uncharacterized protein (DUF1800 family)
MRSSAFAAANPEFADYIAQEFVNHEASPEWIKDVAARWQSAESDVTAVAHDVADGTFTFRNIYESAPQPKGTPTMQNRTFRQLSSAEADQIKRILGKNGTTPTVRANVRQQYHLAEATVDAFAKVINEAAGKPTERTVTESAPPPGVSRRVYGNAVEILEGANRAEEDLTNASVGDLQSLAALEFGNLFRN